ncbi:7-carboxy-7-deazaguanine synthase QueE [Anatilimnocola aggregata]|uniref:7-carboxy-7-deazaguanine synthase QueE n=1 Tax=Anatilimnocola aggregata TaxID=2528021 RepID=UPI00119CEB42|nr:7-carboxy-7-deazaguanine synthase QueE [Anatilimnocola aggregata]
MRIAEIYSSLQGEGRLTGTPSALVRASGCNLRCWFCDTPFTSWRPEGEDRDVVEIVAAVEQLKDRGGSWVKLLAKAGQPADKVALAHVIITGGEPMLFAEMIPLCEELRARDWHITIETSGTLYLPVACDLMSISPKLASSTPVRQGAGNWSDRHERDRHQPAVIRKLIEEYDYQLKFVIDSPADCEAVEQWLHDFPQVDAKHVWLMPQGIEPVELQQRTDWLLPYCQQQGFHYCPRKHIEWFGPGRGT